MQISELLDAEEKVRVVLLQGGKPTDEENAAAWVLARAWLADECASELTVTVTEDDGQPN